MRVDADKFKAWLQNNSLSSSEQTRQQFAQQRLDMKRARKAERAESTWTAWTQAPAVPTHWTHRPLEVLAYLLLAIAIGALLLALFDSIRSGRCLEMMAAVIPTRAPV